MLCTQSMQPKVGLQNTYIMRYRVPLLPPLCGSMCPITTGDHLPKCVWSIARQLELPLFSTFLSIDIVDNSARYSMIMWNSMWNNIYFMWIKCGFPYKTVILLAIATQLAFAMVTYDPRYGIDSRLPTPYNDEVQITLYVCA